MKLKQYQVDAFATRAFEGNPAAVCPLGDWLDDELLQAIAEENNLSETAFFVPSKKGFGLRWFTPVKEVDLCGHATLASAHIIFEALGYGEPVITFETHSGDLFVKRKGQQLEMDFPACPPTPCAGAAIVYLGILGSVVGFTLYYYMIKHLDAGRIALIMLVTPVSALLLGQTLNHERIPAIGWAGIALIGSGLLLYEWQALRQLRRPATS